MDAGFNDHKGDQAAGYSENTSGARYSCKSILFDWVERKSGNRHAAGLPENRAAEKAILWEAGRQFYRRAARPAQQ